MSQRFEKLRWIRASRCSGGTCVEAAQAGDRVLVRDSKDPEGAVLDFSLIEWASFVEGVKEGDFPFA